MKFGLLWHSFSSGNLGVGALSISNMLLIDEAARKCGITPEFLIIGSSGPCDYPPSTERFNYEFIEFNEKALLKTRTAYRAIALRRDLRHRRGRQLFRHLAPSA